MHLESWTNMMTPDILSTMVDRIVKRFHPDCILLFGSQARGDARKWSDVDLMVVVDKDMDRHQTAIEIRRLLRDQPVSKDIVMTTRDEIRRKKHIVDALIYRALQDGKILYGHL